MAQSSRTATPIAAEEKYQPVTLQCGQIADIHFEDEAQPQALSDRLIIVNNFKNRIILTDISVAKPADGKEDQSERSQHEFHVIADDARRFCINDDKQLLAVLCLDKVMLWNLAGVKSIDDFKKVNPVVHMLDHVFHANDLPYHQFFATVDSHIFVKHQTLPDHKHHFSSIDLSNGQRKLIANDTSPHCLLNKKKLCATNSQGKFNLYDIEFKDGQFAISNPVELASDLRNVCMCSVSADGKFLAVTGVPLPANMVHHRQYTVNRYAITPDDKFELRGQFILDCHYLKFLPYFTSQNAMVFHSKHTMKDEADWKIYVVEHDSNDAHPVHNTLCSCGLPNGNIFAMVHSGAFNVTRGRHPVYEQALATLLYTTEIGNVVPEFSVNVAKTIGSYLQDVRFFSAKPLQLANRFDRETLKNVLDSLAVNPDVYQGDKEVIHALLDSLQQTRNVEDCIDEAYRNGGEDSGLAEFLENVKELFSGNVMLSAEPEEETQVSRSWKGCRVM